MVTKNASVDPVAQRLRDHFESGHPRDQMYQSKLNSLELELAHELRRKLTGINSRILRGMAYDDSDLADLAEILRSIREGITKNDTIMGRYMQVSGKTISEIYHGTVRPKYSTFRKVLSGSLKLCDEKINGRSREEVGSAGSALLEAESWVAEWTLINKHPIQEKINVLAHCLEEMVLIVRGRNTLAAGGEKEILTEIQRKQLIALLETALAMLNGPMVEVGLLRRVSEWFTRIISKVAEDELSSALGHAATAGKNAIDSAMGSMF